MGEIDGLTLCKIIKNDLNLHLPVILITGIDSAEMQVEAYNSGVDAFIRKPFEFNVLLARVQNLIKTHKNEHNKSFKLISSKLKSQEEMFIEKLKSEVEKGISNPEFSVEILAESMGYSRANLFRKTKKIIGISPSEYILHTRLHVAANILQDKKLRVTEVAYLVGFSDPHYFSNSFAKHFGVSPSDY
jgi:AraC-like DNA-binding protein